MTRLLVSVRSAAEAEAALRGGAHLIDVKEPANGPLGAATDATIGAVVRAVAGRVPASAALGELEQARHRDKPGLEGLSYLKWGLAGWASRDPLWKNHWGGMAKKLCPPGCGAVAVAYADWQRAEAPTPDAVCAFARAIGAAAFLIDTFDKQRGNLLSWLTPAEIVRLCRLCRAASVPIALAGSLGPEEIRLLRPTEPDWFAVRGAACRGGREGRVDAEKVGELVRLIG